MHHSASFQQRRARIKTSPNKQTHSASRRRRGRATSAARTARRWRPRRRAAGQSLLQTVRAIQEGGECLETLAPTQQTWHQPPISGSATYIVCSAVAPAPAPGSRRRRSLSAARPSLATHERKAAARERGSARARDVAQRAMLVCCFVLCGCTELLD